MVVISNAPFLSFSFSRSSSFFVFLLLDVKSMAFKRLYCVRMLPGFERSSSSSLPSPHLSPHLSSPQLISLYSHAHPLSRS